MNVLRLEPEPEGTYRLVVRTAENRGLSKSFKILAEDMSRDKAIKAYRDLQKAYKRSRLYKDEM